MAYFEEEEPITRLKEALDLNELRNPQGKGVEFEIDDNELNKLDVENETDLKSFDKNQVASNICLMSDEEDANSGDEQYISEVERLRKRMLQNENSDLTSSKDGGVLKQMKTPGIGGVIPRDALVKLHYNAYTDVGQPPYDSTRLRGQELKLRLGKVIFDIEVLHFTEQEGVDDYYSLSPDERRIKLKYTDIEKVVKAENAEAKEYFQSKNYRKAFGKYKRAQDILEGYKLKNDDEEKMYEKQLLKVYVNCAICCHSLSHFGRTITYCNDALRFHKNCVKAHYFKGKALHSLGSFKDAKDSLQRARNLEPSNSVISNALQNLARSMKEYEIFEKNMYTKMFTASSSDSHSETVSAPESVNQTEDNGGEEYGTCSDAFRALVKEHFEKFKQDSSMTEMSFPDITMTPAEIECLLETAVDLGMEVRQIGKDSSSRYEVYKKTARSG